MCVCVIDAREKAIGLEIYLRIMRYKIFCTFAVYAIFLHLFM